MSRDELSERATEREQGCAERAEAERDKERELREAGNHRCKRGEKALRAINRTLGHEDPHVALAKIKAICAWSLSEPLDKEEG